MPAQHAILVTSLVLGWVAFTWWTLRKLWIWTENPRDAWFTKSVKTGGVTVTVSNALILPFVVPMPQLAYWQQAIVWAFYSFPAVLWAMHFGMKMFRALVDRKYP